MQIVSAYKFFCKSSSKGRDICNGRRYAGIRGIGATILNGKEGQKHTAAGVKSKIGIRGNSHGFPGIAAVTGADGICGRAIDFCGNGWRIFQITEEMLLKQMLIFPVIGQSGAEALVVGIGKSIGGIVDQLAHSVVVQNMPDFLLLQPMSHTAHIPQGIFIIMSPEKSLPEGTFQICSRVSVGLDAAKQKSPDIPTGRIGHITFGKKFAEGKVTFSAHDDLLLRGNGWIISYFDDRIVKNCKNRNHAQNYTLFKERTVKNAALENQGGVAIIPR